MPGPLGSVISTQSIAFEGEGGGPEFADNVFRVTDNTDTSKKMAFEVSEVTTATTRTYTAPNFAGTLVLHDGNNTVLDGGNPAFDYFNVGGVAAANVVQLRANGAGGVAAIQPIAVGTGDTNIDLSLSALGTTGRVLCTSPFIFDVNYLEGVETTDPVAPATNAGRIYFKDNGAGKTQLVVRFATGAVQVIATEP